MRILFVDDDPNILQGLRRTLRDRRHQWDMQFAGGGPEALDVLDRAPVDVVVTDMRMPGMDGADLLREVMRRHPHVIRIVLSGQSEQAAVLRALDVTHQYLAKPCDVETLKQTLERASWLRSFLADRPLRELASQLGSIPSPPALYLALLEECRSEHGSQPRVAGIIQQDAAMTANVLRVVNSAFFGRSRRISDPLRAVQLLGLNTVRALALSAHVFSEFLPTRAGAFSIESLQGHSLRTGMIAKCIAAGECGDKAIVDDANLAGVLHDVGQLVLAARLPDAYRGAHELACRDGLSLSDAERDTFGATHGAVGAYLLGLWGLEDRVVEAVAYHHEPGLCLDATAFTPLTAVHVADVLAGEAGQAGPLETRLSLDTEHLARIGVADRLDRWRQSCGRHEDCGDD
jgi:HD-like signal output (HDOD) protein/ActR/RegA family two-component response regulator